jgi:hypothetical protein
MGTSVQKRTDMQPRIDTSKLPPLHGGTADDFLLVDELALLVKAA